MPGLPRIHIVATGGTITGAATSAADTAGYRAGALGIEALLAAIPEAAQLAHLSHEQAFKRDSKDFLPGEWLQLAKQIEQLMTQDDAPAGIVITHGTDTLEETAFFLALTLPRRIPVILTAAMRPASAHSSDGPMNLLQAIAAATRQALAAAGPLIVAANRLWRACDVTKRHTHAPDALGGFEAAPLATAHGTHWRIPPILATQPLFPAPWPDRLPEVWILPGYAGAPAELIDTAIASGVRGLVLALTGHGSVPEAWLPALVRARSQGLAIVRATRVPAGGVTPDANFNDTLQGTLASCGLSPWQARIALMLGLAAGLSHEALQNVFTSAS
ncbi:MAG: asparaginase [Betaproteobacteria bacterium]|nr:asparaginase [Betaproteobacteria bacterium]